MNLETQIVLAAISTAVVASVAMPITIKVLRSKRILDRPNARSLHAAPVPRGAGVPLALAFVVGSIVSDEITTGVWITIVAWSLLGAWDDVKSRSVSLRLTFQILLAALGSLVIAWQLSSPLALIPVGVLVFLVSVNAVNFMDGINGITAMHGIVWGLTYGYLFFVSGSISFAALGVILMVLGITFLPWNFPRPRVFLGDSGSYLMGGLVGSLFLVGLSIGEFVAAIAPLAIYFADTGVTLVRRIRSGESVMTAHRSHTFQRLVGSGWTHTRTASVTVAFTLASAVLGLLTISQGYWMQFGATVGILLICLVYVVLPRLVGNESRRQMWGYE